MSDTGPCSCEQVGILAAEIGRHRDQLRTLGTAVEVVLLDHADQLGGENVDANLSELAYVYEQQTGWTVQHVLGTASGTKRKD